MTCKTEEEVRAYHREWHKKNRKKSRESSRKYEVKRKLEARNLLGDKCFFCSKDRRLHFHKKDGQNHRGIPAFLEVRKKPEAWILLCAVPCHKVVHWMMKFLDISWEQIEKRYRRVYDL